MLSSALPSVAVIKEPEALDQRSLFETFKVDYDKIYSVEEDALSLEEHIGRYAQLLSHVLNGRDEDNASEQREKALLRLFGSFSPELCYEDIVERMVSITCVPSSFAMLPSHERCVYCVAPTHSVAPR